MKSFEQSFNTFGGMMDGATKWMPHVMDNITHDSIVDAELSRYVDLM